MISAQTISQIEIPIEHESDIVTVRQKVRALAQQNAFDSFAQAALITSASELGRNIWHHAGKGLAIISEISGVNRRGIQLEFVDEGPGIADIEKVLRGGFSTARSLGLGLSGTKRLSDEFSIESTPGKGTRVMVRKWKSQTVSRING